MDEKENSILLKLFINGNCLLALIYIRPPSHHSESIVTSVFVAAKR